MSFNYKVQYCFSYRKYVNICVSSEEFFGQKLEAFILFIIFDVISFSNHSFTKNSSKVSPRCSNQS